MWQLIKQRNFLKLMVACFFFFSGQLPLHAEAHGNHQAFLPLIIQPYPQISTPYEVTLSVTPDGGMTSSTFESGTFILQNTGQAGQVVSVTLDLSTAVLPDLTFDPNGNAGDTIAKDLSVDSGQFRTGYLERHYANPHEGGGFDQLTLLFNSFDPEDTLTFSVDIDPTSIKGVQAPGPFESGSVAGLEMVGMTVHALLADGTHLTGQLTYLTGSIAGGQAVLTEGIPPTPTAMLVDLTTPTETAVPEQQLQITGRPFMQYHVMRVEGGLFLDGAGFDIDPFEANSLLLVTEHTGSLGASGSIQLPITLSKSRAEAGINTIGVWVEDSNGRLSQISPFLTVELLP